MIATAAAVTGRDIPVEEAPRRPGDPAVLVAGAARIQAELGWKPQYPELSQIIATSWEWHREHPEGYGGE